MRVRNSRAALLSDYEVLTVMREMDRKLQDAAKLAASSSSSPSISTPPLPAPSSSAINQEETALNVGTTTTTNNNSSNNGNTDYSTLDNEEEKMFKSIPPNLRSIQYKVLETLSNVQRPCTHQESKTIPAFMDAISAWERGRPVVGLTQKRRSQDPIEKERRLTKGEKLMLINHAPTEFVVLHALVEELHDRLTNDEQGDLLAIIADLLPMDETAMNRDDATAGAQASVEQDIQDMEYDETGQQTYVGEADDDEGIIEDMDELENEGRGEGAVDDEGNDDD